MDARVVVVNCLPTVSGDIREQGFEKLCAIARAGREDEPGMLRYAVCVPQVDDGKLVYTVEEYVDKAAFELHMQAPGVKHINEWGVENNAIDMGAAVGPASYVLGYVPGLVFERDGSLAPAEPVHLKLMRVEVAPGGVEEFISRLRVAVEAARDGEPRVLLRGVLRDGQANDALFVIEAYDGPQSSTGAVQGIVEGAQGLAAGFEVHDLKMAGGFLTTTRQ